MVWRGQHMELQRRYACESLHCFMLRVCYCTIIVSYSALYATLLFAQYSFLLNDVLSDMSLPSLCL
jgi:hypothetical protein